MNGTETTLSFTKVLATGLRLTFATPGSYLKIPEIVVPEAGGIAAITPMLSPEAPATGWYRGPVAVQLSHDGNDQVIVQHRTDGGDWVDGTTFEVTGDGEHLVDYRALLDDVEQEGVSGSLTVRIDATAPVTGASVADAAAATRTLVLPDVAAPVIARGQVVTLEATDATSGVASTEYSLDAGSTWTTGTEIALTTVGTYQVSFRSTDVAGNVEQVRTAEVTVTAQGGTDPGTTPGGTDPGTTPGGSGAGTTPGGNGRARRPAGTARGLRRRRPRGIRYRPRRPRTHGTEAPLALTVLAFGAVIAGAALVLVRRRRA